MVKKKLNKNVEVDFSWNMHLFIVISWYILYVFFLLLSLKMVWDQAETAIRNHNEDHTDRSYDQIP